MEAPIKTRYDKAGPQVAEALRRGWGVERVFELTASDTYFEAQAAVDAGLADRIITTL